MARWSARFGSDSVADIGHLSLVSHCVVKGGSEGTRSFRTWLMECCDLSMQFGLGSDFHTFALIMFNTAELVILRKY